MKQITINNLKDFIEDKFKIFWCGCGLFVNLKFVINLKLKMFI